MHASTITSTILFSLLSLGAFAAPSAELHKRDNKCTSTDYSALKRWNIWVDNDANFNKACGSGCLDNIRGRCGSSVTDWGCDRSDNGQGYYHFNTPTTCTEYDMTQALKACLKGTTIDCTAN